MEYLQRMEHVMVCSMAVLCVGPTDTVCYSYLPVALALSTWSTTDASAANASVVVQWLNCLDNTLMQRQHCATKLLPGTALLPDAKPRFHIETHDFANCYWMADKRRHMHLRDCATVSSRSDDEVALSQNNCTAAAV
eukprot:m.666406 g.666406  ORF g.666406 m.666406 type:complete len:137 (-) comp22749_c2_seq15:938-1348(-)